MVTKQGSRVCSCASEGITQVLRCTIHKMSDNSKAPGYSPGPRHYISRRHCVAWRAFEGAGATPWMAPELLDEIFTRPRVTRETDVYAMGILIIEVLWSGIIIFHPCADQFITV